MKRAIVAIAVLAAACSVNRRSNQLACTSSTTCSDGRTCVQGFCVFDDGGVAKGDGPQGNCPSQCTSCNNGQMTCNITGGSGNDVVCPAGWDCTINCSATGSCSSVSCNNASSCTVECSGVGSCAHVDCGNAQCAVHCSGTGACSQVDCPSSCQCDVTCAGTNACSTLQCPMLPNGNHYCTTNGNNGQPCSSSFAAQCASC